MSMIAAPHVDQQKIQAPSDERPEEATHSLVWELKLGDGRHPGRPVSFATTGQVSWLQRFPLSQSTIAYHQSQ